MKLKIRRANISDTNLIAALGATTFYEAYFEQDDPVFLGDYITESFNPGQIRKELESPASAFFIAERGGKAVGYAKLRDEMPEPCVKHKPSVELQRIYLLQAVWGKGIGEMVLQKCLEEARTKGCKSVWLSVWEQNLRAQKFYEKQGFERVGELNFLFGENVETNLVMEKLL